MKKNTRVRVAKLELEQRRVLRLAQETVRALTAHDLTGVIAGCNTTSWSTEAPPATNNAC
jgi:hypothetical protein